MFTARAEPQALRFDNVVNLPLELLSRDARDLCAELQALRFMPDHFCLSD
jgi:hypothetical protein